MAGTTPQTDTPDEEPTGPQARLLGAMPASGRDRAEEGVRSGEARLRAAPELAGLGIYSWNLLTGAVTSDERLCAMWGIREGTVITQEIIQDGIHPEDLPRVRRAIADCMDPAGDGRYDIEYRVVGRDDGITRTIATSGRTSFAGGRAIGFIGAALDVTARRLGEAEVRASEAQFRSFAESSSNLIWIADPAAGTILFRSRAYEKIWGVPCADAPTSVSAWMRDVHDDDRQHVENALATVRSGEVAQFEYRITRPVDGLVRWLRDTSFPILDGSGAVARIGGITEDLTQDEGDQVYVVSPSDTGARQLAALVRANGRRARMFVGSSEFLGIAAFLAPGTVLIDLRRRRAEGLAILRELKTQSIALPTIALDAPDGGAATAVAAMKAGAVDYLIGDTEAVLRVVLGGALSDCHAAHQATTPYANAHARVGKLTLREREVLSGLVEGGTNKGIGQKLGISPRTVELHRAQVMHRLNVSNLAELLRVAMAAGL